MLKERKPLVFCGTREGFVRAASKMCSPFCIDAAHALTQLKERDVRVSLDDSLMSIGFCASSRAACPESRASNFFCVHFWRTSNLPWIQLFIRKPFSRPSKARIDSSFLPHKSGHVAVAADETTLPIGAAKHAFSRRWINAESDGYA